MSSKSVTQPSIESLPLKRPGPQYNAWGLYGDDDELGRVNLITPDAIKRGKEAIKEGKVINLNMPMDMIPVMPRRIPLEHTVIGKGHANDDVLKFNTQSSTQWDGFKHFPYTWEGKKVHYMGLPIEEAEKGSCKRYGVDNFAKTPLSSRAHLLDMVRYVEKHNLKPLSIFDNSSPVTLDMLKGCAKEEGVEFAPGDILLVRIGWTEEFEKLPDDEKRKLAVRDHPACGGVIQGADVLKWHWDNGFAAVAGDAVAYEAWPALESPKLHEVFLGGWGLPIGEMFDLRELAAECARLNRWTFFLASISLFVPGGIASPANAQAIL